MLGLVDEKGSWKNATIMAKASFYAYSNKSAFDKEFSTECVLWDKEGTQAFGWQDGRNVCVVFRGTEALQWSDIKADLKVRKVKCPTGFVHRGFKDALDKIWPDILKWIEDIENMSKPIDV